VIPILSHSAGVGSRVSMLKKGFALSTEYFVVSLNFGCPLVTRVGAIYYDGKPCGIGPHIAKASSTVPVINVKLSERLGSYTELLISVTRPPPV
jgi:hypothetical protein